MYVSENQTVRGGAESIRNAVVRSAPPQPALHQMKKKRTVSEFLNWFAHPNMIAQVITGHTSHMHIL